LEQVCETLFLQILLQFSRGGAGVFAKSFFIFLVLTSLQLANEDAVYFLAAASQESTSLFVQITQLCLPLHKESC
jgi:hypothetical protein